MEPGLLPLPCSIWHCLHGSSVQGGIGRTDRYFWVQEVLKCGPLPFGKASDFDLWSLK